MMPACVITTIHRPTEIVRSVVDRFPGHVIVIGDQKTPAGWQLPKAEFYAHDARYGLSLVGHLPANHYARKNLGYLIAMHRGASFIYDTDDDNMPASTWRMRDEYCASEVVTSSGWCNVYRLFHQAGMWPRGFALEHVSDPAHVVVETAEVRCPIQQGLAEGEPDVDAIWRLTGKLSNLGEAIFCGNRTISLARGVWCPFNSQTTWWWPCAYPLLYLPVSATFRMTDIWRSFVAQRCIWEMGGKVAFHSPAEVIQHRNAHNLLSDFESEIPGYLNNGRIVETLSELKLHQGQDIEIVVDNLLTCYESLVRIGVLHSLEMKSVEAWAEDVRQLKRS